MMSNVFTVMRQFTLLTNMNSNSKPSSNKKVNYFSISVKLWNINMEHSVQCIEAKANVCCVKFNPESRFHLAFGSAGKFVTLHFQLNCTKLCDPNIPFH